MRVPPGNTNFEIGTLAPTPWRAPTKKSIVASSQVCRSADVDREDSHVSPTLDPSHRIPRAVHLRADAHRIVTSRIAASCVAIRRVEIRPRTLSGLVGADALDRARRQPLRPDQDCRPRPAGPAHGRVSGAVRSGPQGSGRWRPRRQPDLFMPPGRPATGYGGQPRNPNPRSPRR